MEALLTQVLNGIARSMAPTGLKKALSFKVVRLASQEHVQQSRVLHVGWAGALQLDCRPLENVGRIGPVGTRLFPSSLNKIA